MDYKKEFLEAKKANDWNKVNELWKALCVEAEIEETSDGLPDGINKELAEYRNRQAAGNMQGGKKI